MLDEWNDDAAHWGLVHEDAVFGSAGSYFVFMHDTYASATVSKMTATYLRRPPKYRRLMHQAEAGPRGKRVKKNLEEIKL